MRADLGAFFEHHDVQIGVDLFQPDRGRKARGARADDHDVVFHAFAFDLGHRHPLASIGRRRPRVTQQCFADA
jgi:hypothetical protein